MTYSFCLLLFFPDDNSEVLGIGGLHLVLCIPILLLFIDCLSLGDSASAYSSGS